MVPRQKVIYSTSTRDAVLRAGPGLSAELRYKHRAYLIPAPLGAELLREAETAAERLSGRPLCADDFDRWLHDTCDAIAYALTPAPQRDNRRPPPL